MSNVKHAHPLIRSSVPSVPLGPSVPSSRAVPWCARERHDLHRIVEGDWPPTKRSQAEVRRSLAIGLAAVAMLPAVEIMLTLQPGAPREVVAALASLPLVALLLVAVTWRSGGGS